VNKQRSIANNPVENPEKWVDLYKAKEQPIYDIEPDINKLDDLFDENGHWKIKPAKWDADRQKLYDQKEFIKILHKCLRNFPAGRPVRLFPEKLVVKIQSIFVRFWKFLRPIVGRYFTEPACI
jgi:hypothetical protein